MKILTPAPQRLCVKFLSGVIANLYAKPARFLKGKKFN